MIDLGVQCSCRFCRPYRDRLVDARWQPCGCPLGAACRHDSRLVVEGIEYPPDRVVHTGGRCGRCLLLDDGEQYVWLAAGQRGSPLADLGLRGVEIARLPASAHGCWKTHKRQEVVIYRPADN
jgi:hypothetical protein